MIHLTDIDQAPYSAPAPQTATVSDEAVQAAIKKSIERTDPTAEGHIRDMLTAALPHLSLSAAPCSVEVKKLEWIRPETVHESVTYFRADTVFGKYGAWGGGRAELNDVEINSDRGSIDLAKAAAQADFERRTLSQIFTKPVDVAAVRCAAFREGADAAVRYHNHEAEYYEARHGSKDGVPFPIVAGWHRLDAAAIRALSPAEPVDQSRVAQLEAALTSILFEDSDKSEQQRMIDRVKARAVLEQAEPVDQWQDIATAPKDQSILIHYDSGSIELVDADDNDYQWIAYTGKETFCTKPTHWMPLPAAPTSKGGA